MNYKIKNIKQKLDFFIENEKLKSIYSYRKCAKLFKQLINEIIFQILKKHNYKIKLKVNNIPLALEGSVINSSTAMGYIVEELLIRELKNNKYSKSFIYPSSTVDSVYDLKYNSNKIDLFCNIKIEKFGDFKFGKRISKKSSNNAVASIENLQISYLKNPNRPKLYLITKIPYSINVVTSEILFNKGIINLFMESFILKYVKSDGRSWKKGEAKKISGRLQTPSKMHIKKYGVNTIPHYNAIFNRIKYLEDFL